jgi:8-oxo-dGTP pyrophosphatase MutT (NUDIX family)
MAAYEKNGHVEIIQAAGGLIWRESAHGKEVAIIHRGRYGDWTLPKGKLNPGETFQEAAVREVKEETGCDVKLERFAGTVNYEVNGNPKIVLFWNMRIINECAFKPSEEVDQVLWLTVKEALEKLDYSGERNLLKNIDESQGNKVTKGTYWSLLSGRNAKRTRLEGSILALEKELNWLKEVTNKADSCWVRSSEDMLIEAKKAIKVNNFDLGWRCLNTARSLSFLGLDFNKNYRRVKAVVIWADAKAKLGGWRKDTINALLLDKDIINPEISNYDLFQAHQILSEHYENQYYRIDAFERHLLILFCAAAAAICSLILLAASGEDFIKLSGWKYILSIVLFGIMGAVVSGMLSARGGTQARIPEQQISNSMTLAKLAVGAISALSIYVFITSGIFTIGAIDSAKTPQVILAVSFAAGFTERLVNRAVETVAAKNPKK